MITPNYTSLDGRIRFYNCDCMELMSSGKVWDLAVVDPEFGIGIGKSARLVTDKGMKSKTWDDKPIDDKYFDVLFCISKNQIIWGGNYYPLPANKHCFIWDKKQPEKLSFGMFDYAWTSFVGANKIFRQSAQKETVSWHPTSKPIQLYRWTLQNYAKAGDTIIDTHGGSMSSAIACHMEGFELDICELDKEYFDAAVNRFKIYEQQQKLF
mgnify:CR=1 FL=1